MTRSFAMLLFCLGAAPAGAEAACAPVEAMVGELARRYQERPVATATAAAGEPVLILASGTGSWSMLVLVEDGARACLVASGTGWRGFAGRPPGAPA